MTVDAVAQPSGWVGSELVGRWDAVARRGDPVAEVDVVASAWQTTGDLRASTVLRLAEVADRFAHRLAATGVASLLDVDGGDCEAFVWAPTGHGGPPALATVHLRRSTLRTVYRTVAWLHDDHVVDPSAQLVLPAKTVRSARPLDDDEVVLVRTTAAGRRDRRRDTAAVALAEAGATTGEIAQVCWRDVDLSAAAVQLPGAAPVTPRCVELTGWGAAVLAETHAATEAPAGVAVVYRGAAGGASQAGQAAVANRLRRILHAAGLVEADVRPVSLRLWAGRRALRRGGIEAAARWLGLASLDATAEAVGHSWQARP